MWLAVIRPATLPAGAAPVVVGTAVAAATGGWRPGVALAALVAAL
ncbi:MAG: 1,4-dihydroxy-2-naphthoate polyprenyltransferase, partial [Deltaproteobacteria bacterium HGW-Deltaproteobacteria-14]